MKKRNLYVQFFEYMVGGGVYFWSGLGVFALLFHVFHWHWFWAKVMADIVGWSLNFTIQRYWAFYDPKLKGQDRKVITKYVIVNFVDLFWDYGIVAAIINAGVTPYAGFLLSAGFTTVWDYFWYRFWVFKPSKK